jgi:excinuclease ABC subunit C
MRTYFQESRNLDERKDQMMDAIEDVEFIMTDTEGEALALENNLIKQHQPKYNILLRDDKTYPYIKLTNERFPRVYVTRRLKKDGSTYFGPYFPGNLAWRLLHFIHKFFKVSPGFP